LIKCDTYYDYNTLIQSHGKKEVNSSLLKGIYTAYLYTSDTREYEKAHERYFCSIVLEYAWDKEVETKGDFKHLSHV
jgi:hypothetical protein